MNRKITIDVDESYVQRIEKIALECESSIGRTTDFVIAMGLLWCEEYLDDDGSKDILRDMCRNYVEPWKLRQ